MARLAKNSLSGAVYLLAQIVASFVVTPIIVHQLGNAAYGAWEVTIAVVSYVSLLELGFGQATLRGIALGRGQGNQDLVRATVSSSFVALASMGIVGGTALLLASPWGDAIIGTRQHPEIPGTLLLVGAAAMVLMQFIITPLAGLAGGLQEFVKLNAARTVLLILRSIATVWLLTNGGGLPEFAWLTAGFAVLQVAVLTLLFRAPLREWLRVSQASWSSVKELAAFGLKSSVLQSASTAVRSFIPLLISHTIGPASIVYYSLANRLAEYGLSFSVALGTPLMGIYAEMGSTGTSALRNTWAQTTRILQFFSLGVPTGLFFFGSPFIGLWMGPSYAEGSYWPMKILCLGLLAQGLATNCARLVTSQDQHGRLAGLAALFAVVALPAAWFCSRSWGVTGAATGLGFYLLGLAASELKLGYRIIDLKIREGLSQTSLRYWIALPGLALISHLLIGLGAGKTYAQWIVSVLAAGTLYTLLAAFTAWTSEDRRRIVRLIRP